MRSTSRPALDAARRLLELLETLGRRNSLRDPLAAIVEAMDLTHPQLHAVMWLGRDGCLTMGELAQRLGVTEKTITGLVDRLERAHYVERVRDREDRRVVKVVLTATGLAAWQRMDAEVAEKTATFLSLLEREDRDALFRIAERLVQKSQPAQPDRAAPSPRRKA